jgi:NAD(P)-dependent dehydrogenase (short-subunit alcohol dehydrogenase family)
MRSVLITGASTGIGRACALRLDRSGWRVYAGIRDPSHADELASASSERLRPVTIDVTDAATITATADLLRDELGEEGLQGLVNNAGISVQGPLEHLALDEFRRQFEVNLTGQLAVTQAVLQLVRTGRGRIVMMSSISGRAMSLPLIAPYSASKVALEAVGEALRYELLPEGIHVTLVEPGVIDTPIWSKGDSTVDPTIEALPQDARTRYSTMIRQGARLAAQRARRGLEPDRVARRVEHALTSSRPRLRYLVGLDAHLRAYSEPFIPQLLKDRIVRRLFGM